VGAEPKASSSSRFALTEPSVPRGTLRTARTHPMASGPSRLALTEPICSTWNTLDRKDPYHGFQHLPVHLASPNLFHVEHFGPQGPIPRLPAPLCPPGLPQSVPRGTLRTARTHPMAFSTSRFALTEPICSTWNTFGPQGPIPRLPAPLGPPRPPSICSTWNTSDRKDPSHGFQYLPVRPN